MALCRIGSKLTRVAREEEIAFEMTLSRDVRSDLTKKIPNVNRLPERAISRQKTKTNKEKTRQNTMMIKRIEIEPKGS